VVFSDDIAQPIGELRMSVYHALAPFCAAAFLHEASTDRKNCAATILCAVVIAAGPRPETERLGTDPGMGDW
jgi:hypothetical protein